MVNSNIARASAVAARASVNALRLENRYCFSDFLSSFLNGSPHIVLGNEDGRYQNNGMTLTARSGMHTYKQLSSTCDRKPSASPGRAVSVPSLFKRHPPS